MTTEQLEQARQIILEYTERLQHASFAEMEDQFKKKVLVMPVENTSNYKNAYEVIDLAPSDKYSNIIIWCSKNGLLIDACISLFNEKPQQIFTFPTGLLTYSVDGYMLNFPIATKLTHYKEIHWMPMLLVYGKEMLVKYQRQMKKTK